MKISREQAIRATIAYADIFDYPLTFKELEMWAIGRSIKILQRKDYFFRPGQKKIIDTRLQREKLSKNKWKIVTGVSNWLKFIPTIKLVGVTGGLAMNNADEDDDIDLFFITSSGSLWLSRLMAIILVELLGKRRHPKQTQVKNLICLNMFMSEKKLSLPQTERDLFSAHEVLQMTPLWEKDRVYARFLQANKWVKNFLPKAWEEKCKVKSAKYKVNNYKSTYWSIVRPLEFLVKYIQLWYMRKRRSTEIITDYCLRFHPQDARFWIKKALDKRLQRYNIPLDKIFYGR